MRFNPRHFSNTTIKFYDGMRWFYRTIPNLEIRHDGVSSYDRRCCPEWPLEAVNEYIGDHAAGPVCYWQWLDRSRWRTWDPINRRWNA